MRVIPVVDLRGGRVVHAVAGQRNRYAPLRSPLCLDACPATLAEALVGQLGASTVYLADLDALAGSAPDWDSYAAFTARGLRLWIDAGLCGADPTTCTRLAAWPEGRAVILAATETLSGLTGLAAVVESLGPLRTALSLDLRQGRTLAAPGGWPTPTPQGIVAAALALGVRRFVVLDVAAVGRDRGPATLELCGAIRQLAPDAEIVSGGGVRGEADLWQLQAGGCDAALVATALHDGRLGRRHVCGLAAAERPPQNDSAATS